MTGALRPLGARGLPGADGVDGDDGATGPAGPAPAGSAGDDVRLVSTGVAGATSPDVVCTVAELATTYAPSAVLRGVIAYATDEEATYVCRRTAASTYAWALLAYSSFPASALAPILRYRLDETSGTTLVNSGSASSADAAITGTPSLGRDMPGGRRAAWWTAAATTYGLGPTDVQPTHPITIMAWAYPLAFSKAYAKILYKPYNAASWSAPEGTGLTFDVSGASTGTVEGHICVAGTRYAVTIASTADRLRLGEEQLVALTYDGADMVLSINGKPVGTAARTGAIDYGAGTAQPWMIAGNSRVAGTDEGFNGLLADAMVLPSALTSAQLRALYLRGVRRWEGS